LPQKQVIKVQCRTIVLMISFASDTWVPVHPHVMQTLREANEGTAPAYGHDEWTARCQDLFKREFGPDAIAFPVFTGTAANVLCVASLVREHQTLLLAETAHMNVHECGAVERFAGCKLKTVAAPDGRLTLDSLRPYVKGMAPHEGNAGAVSLTQSTELGTTYSLAQLEETGEFCRENDLYFHVDGSRLSNAAAFLDVSLKQLTSDVGVDALSFGGTKNGLMGTDAVVFFDPELAEDFEFTRLQGLNLASKMRFLSAQWVACLEDGLWKKNAAHANAMAQRLYGKVKDISGLEILQKPEANILFARLPPEAIAELTKRFAFYVLNPARHEVRWLTSWDTTEVQVDAFAEALTGVMAST